MKVFNKISIFIIAFLIISKIQAQEATAWASLDSNAITIGDQIKYELGITIPDNMTVSWPQFSDTITKNIEILKRSNIDTSFSQSNITLHQQFLITSFDSGYFEIPPVNFKYGNTTDTLTASTGTLFLQVYVPEVDTTKAFKAISGPIKEPYTFKELLPWILVGTAAILLIALLIYYLVKRKKKQPIFKRRSKPKLPAHILAINKLEELRLTKLWQSGHLKKYYSELTDILREYLVNRYQFDAQEMTSYEITNKLNEFGINKDAMGKINGVMYLSDMVKFAKAIPTALENDLGLTHCVDFVNETKLVEQPVQKEDIDNTKLS